MPTVNFFQPGTDAAVEQQQIDRQRQMAQALLLQAQKPSGGQMVSGHYVAPGIASALTQALQGAGSHLVNERADQKQTAMGEALRARNAKEANDFMTAVNGSPAKNVPLNVPNDDEGNPLPAAQSAAIAPDKTRAMAIALQSQNPMLQSAGGDMMKNQMLASQIGEALGVPAGGTPGATPAGGAAGAPGGLLGGLSPTVVKLALAGPVGEKLAGMVQDANKPIPLREGDLVRQDAQGNYVSAYQSPKLDPGIVPTRDAQGQVTSAAPIPGYAASVGQIQGAKANATQGAESANTMVTVDTPGGPRMMTRAQALQMSQGGQATPVAPQAAVAPRPLAPAAPLPAGPLSLNSQVPAQPDLRGNFTGTPAQQMSAINGIPNVQERAKALAALQNQTQGTNPPFNPQGGDPNIPTSIPSLSATGQPVQAGPGIALQDEGSKKFSTQIAAQSADALTASRDKAKSAADAQMTIAQARDAIKGGSFQGSGAEAKLAIAKFVNANIPGINIDPEKVANTDYLKSTLGAGLLAEAKTLGTNPSNADAQRINDIVGSIGKDPNAMNKILDWRQSMAQRVIDQHNATVGDAEKRGMTSPYDLRVKAPGVAPVSSGFKILGVQ